MAVCAARVSWLATVPALEHPSVYVPSSLVCATCKGYRWGTSHRLLISGDLSGPKRIHSKHVSRLLCILDEGWSPCGYGCRPVKSSGRKWGGNRGLVARVSEISGRNGEGAGGQNSVLDKREEDTGKLGPRARLVAQRSESFRIEEVQRPLAQYMSLPASQYSVLDAERIERVDDTMFRCYAHRLKFFKFEVVPVLLVRVEEQPNGCCIRLLSCTLEGSPIVVAQNKKFSASMVNKVSWSESERPSLARHLNSDTTIEVTIEIPPAFRALPIGAIEGAGNKVLSQLLKVMLPRFLAQLGKDYYAWASGDSSRQPLGTGEL